MNIPELLSDLSINYSAIIRKAAGKLNLTSSQAFQLLSVPYDGIAMSQLSNKLGLDTSTLTRNINNLIKINLVIKRQDSEDKRIYKIFLTQSGLNTVAKIENSLLETHNQVFKTLDLDYQENLIEILEKLVWSFDCLKENNR